MDDRLEAEQALAEFHARIPEAARELVRLYVTTDDPLARQRLRGRLHTLLDYLDVDHEAGRPAPRSPYGPLLVEVAQAVLPVLMSQAVRLARPAARTAPAPPTLPLPANPLADVEEMINAFTRVVPPKPPKDDETH